MKQRTESIFQELKKNSAFDFNQAVKDLMSGKKLTGEDLSFNPSNQRTCRNSPIRRSRVSYFIIFAPYVINGFS